MFSSLKLYSWQQENWPMQIKKKLLSVLPQLEAFSTIPTSTNLPRAGRRLVALLLAGDMMASRNRQVKQILSLRLYKYRPHMAAWPKDLPPQSRNQFARLPRRSVECLKRLSSNEVYIWESGSLTARVWLPAATVLATFVDLIITPIRQKPSIPGTIPRLDWRKEGWMGWGGKKDLKVYFLLSEGS